MTEPCDLDASAARRQIGARKLAPTELLESCISWIEAVNHAVNAIVACDFERARAAAAAHDEAVARGDALPPLHGLPLAVKDLEPTAGLRTTWGSPLFRDHVPDVDQGAVARAREAGAIVLGKTNVPEFGLGANTRNPVYGATGNPFNPALSAAGSSGGSAVALATGMTPLATGSDTGGSLRNPAAFCGVVGFRPTPGLVPDERRGIGASGLRVLGPMARTVPDVVMLLAAMSGDDSRDMLNRGGVTVAGECDLAGLRVAATEDFGFAPTARDVRATFGDKIALFRHLFARCEVATPDCSGSDECFAVLRAISVLAEHGARVRDFPTLCGPNLRANIEEGQRYSAVDVARAMAAQTAIYQRWQTFFANYDVIVSPAITVSPRPWTELYPEEIDGEPTASYFHWLALAYAVTVVGHPALSLPIGLDHAGMPFGLQIVGPRGGDAKVLAVAAALERELSGDARTCRPRPDIAALRRAPAIAQMSGFI
jgi:Asp-tRNA(Asn)/Glu-tRNA(Gln) amidotransferase A subunit family amidase